MGSEMCIRDSHCGGHRHAVASRTPCEINTSIDAACGVQEYLKNYYAEKKSRRSIVDKSSTSLSSSPTGAGPGHTILKKSLDHHETPSGGDGGAGEATSSSFSHGVSLPNRHAKFRDVVEIVEFGERDKVPNVLPLLFMVALWNRQGGAVMQRVRHLGLRSVGRGFKSCSRQRCVRQP